MDKYKSKVVSLVLAIIMIFLTVEQSFATMQDLGKNPGPHRAHMYTNYIDKFGVELNKEYLWNNGVKTTVEDFYNFDTTEGAKLLGVDVWAEIEKDYNDVLAKSVRPGATNTTWSIIEYVYKDDTGALMNELYYYRRALKAKALSSNDGGLDKYDINRVMVSNIAYMSSAADDKNGLAPEGLYILDEAGIATKMQEVNESVVSFEVYMNRPLEKLVLVMETKGKVTLKDGDKYIAQDGSEIDVSLGTDNQPKNNKGEFLRRVGSYKNETGATVENPAETFVLPARAEEGFLGWKIKEVQDTNTGVKKESTGEAKDIEEGSFTVGEETDVDRVFKAGTTIKIKNDVVFEAAYKEDVTTTSSKIVKNAAGNTLAENTIVKTEDILTYEVDVKASKDTFVKIEDDIPAGTEYVADSAVVSKGTASEDAGRITTENVKVDANETLKLTFKVKVTAENGVINNTAKVTPSKVNGDVPGEAGTVQEPKAPKLLVIAKDNQAIIKKVDSATGKPLAGATFRLYKAPEGDTTGDKITGKGTVVADKAALEAEKIALETEKAELESKKTELNKDEDKLEAEKDKAEANKTAIKELEEKIKAKKEEIAKIEAKLVEIEAKLEAKEEEIQEKQEEIEDAIDAIKEQIEEKQGLLEKATNVLSDDERAVLETEKANLETEKTELEAELVEKEEALLKLKEENKETSEEGNKEELEKIETRLGEIQTRLEAIEKEIKAEVVLEAAPLEAQEYTTDENGMIVISKIPDIATVKYKIKEIKAPTGYILESREYDIPKELNQVIEVKNTRMVEETKYRVTYDGNGNTSGSAPTDGRSPYEKGSKVTVLGNESLRRTKHSFKGWSTSASASRVEYRSGDTFTITEDTRLYAVCDKDSDGGGDKPDPEKPKPVKPDPEKPRTKDPKGREYGTVIEPKIEYELNKKDHFAYIKGYPDITVKPNGYITREEVSMVFYRLMEPEYRTEIETNNHKYSDVKDGKWSTRAVATLSNGELLKGYPDGTFKPQNNMTRAEISKVIARFTDTVVLETQMPDIIGHWAEDYINTVEKKGWVKGYNDGTFKPDELLTRAEFVTMVNSLLDRKVLKENALPGLKEFKDLEMTKWYYEQMIEAINGHEYEDKRLPDGTEKWIKLVDTQFPD